MSEFAWYPRRSKRTTDMLELRLEAVISHHVLLGINLGPSEKLPIILIAEPSVLECPNPNPNVDQAGLPLFPKY